MTIVTALLIILGISIGLLLIYFGVSIATDKSLTSGSIQEKIGQYMGGTVFVMSGIVIILLLVAWGLHLNGIQ